MIGYTLFFDTYYIMSRNIELVIFDFDGVFTDGSIFYDSTGNVMKYYNIKDGMGLKLLRDNEIKTAMISGFKENVSQSEIAKHLKMDNIIFHAKDKVAEANNLCEKYHISLNNVAFIGDDINDVELMTLVKISATPNDGVQECKNIVTFVSKYAGGNGCVRDFCEYIIAHNQRKWMVIYGWYNFPYNVIYI